MHVLAFSLQKMQCSRKIASSNITIGMVASQFHVFLQSCKSSYNIAKVIQDTYLYFITKCTGKKIFDLKLIGENNKRCSYHLGNIGILVLL